MRVLPLILLAVHQGLCVLDCDTLPATVSCAGDTVTGDYNYQIQQFDFPGINFGLISFPTQAVSPVVTLLVAGVGGQIDITVDALGDVDSDFVLWGPFPDPNAAVAACPDWGTGGPNGNVVDCGFFVTIVCAAVAMNNVTELADETPRIVGANPGDVYVLLISNFYQADQDYQIIVDNAPPQRPCDNTLSCC
eukprot:gene5726-5665_t